MVFVQILKMSGIGAILVHLNVEVTFKGPLLLFTRCLHILLGLRWSYLAYIV